MEKEVLGFYLSSHPLAEHEQTLSRYCHHTTADVHDLPDRQEVTLGGILSAVIHRHVKSPRPGAPTKFASFDLEDKQGIVRCNLWPDSYVEYGSLVQSDAILVVRGQLDRRGGGDEPNLSVTELIPLDQLESRYTTGLVIRVDEPAHGLEKLAQVREIVRGYPGACELRLVLCLRDGSRVHLKSHRIQIEVTSELRDRLDQLLGPGNLRLVTTKPRVAENKNGRRGRNGQSGTAH